MLIQKKTEVINYPKRLLTYGAPKVGKTTSLSHLPNALIVDLENGTDNVKGDIVNIPKILREGYEGSEIDILRALYSQLLEDNPYTFIIFDTIDEIERIVAKSIEKEYEVESYGDLPYGKGYALLRDKVISMFNLFNDLGLIVILVGHRKKTIIGKEGTEVKVKDLDLTGKLKNYLFGWADAIGYWNREINEDGTSTSYLSFKVDSEENTESGCRIDRLEGLNIPILHKGKEGFQHNWKEIFPFQGE